MSEPRKTIRQMCEEYDVTPRTLRFYESKELLSPLREGQKRLYGKRSQARLKLILQGKRFGFSLEEIRQLLDLYYIGDQQRTQMTETYELAQERLAAMKQQRDELNQTIAEFEKQLEWGADFIANTFAQEAAE
ncbi:MerR family transcriptional regulator [Neptunicoccus cionae]|uniref:MerR family transcriptional regulator n=1 Tax=Neptunicoccus cionae TaxID=2035344 RepID=A0A916QVG7_9RHOB|nr:MerR family DNA-binding transcriptional regulator [Amylibacter cionae]GGA15086.1 MerR family transcriptional regulator [Amylibacter cionae]